MIERACLECKVPFTVQYASSRKTYCSRSCATRVTARSRTGDRNSRWDGGKTSHPLYEVYCEIIARCERTTHARWKDYGERGIDICQEWRGDFWAFVRDVGERPAPGMSLDRIDNDGNYEPKNMRWATARQQNINRRTAGWENRTRNEKGRFI